VKRVLVVGGSDSGGGAGIQADLKTLQALGVHASTVLTAVTAQSSTAVHDIHDLPGTSVRAQLAAVLDDIGADVVKTGMLSSAEAVAAVVDAVRGFPLVVDPVGVSSTGQSLLAPDALVLLRSRLLPLATVVTPNLAEVEALTGFVVRDATDLPEAARWVHALGPQWVLVKGGHLPGPPLDLLYDGTVSTELPGARFDTPHTHGTGCTLASALAGYLALGSTLPDAAASAKAYVTEAIRGGYPLGKGAGTVRQGVACSHPEGELR
jgi:hydroxymethylpyrimidine/phosphomethylpyrimidine kinase